MIKPLLSLLFVFAVTSQNSGEYINKHTRRIYYSQWDNMCDGHGSDSVVANFYFEDMDKITGELRRGSYCDQWRSTGAARIQTLGSAYYMECPEGKYKQCNLAQFHQKRINHKFLLWLKIDLVLTPQNPMQFKGKKQYNCQILGTKQIAHFGPSRKHPAPQMNVKCTKIRTNSIKQSQQ